LVLTMFPNNMPEDQGSLENCVVRGVGAHKSFKERSMEWGIPCPFNSEERE